MIKEISIDGMSIRQPVFKDKELKELIDTILCSNNEILRMNSKLISSLCVSCEEENSKDHNDK